MPLPRYYVGLAATFHDPALAVVDERGEVLFAEASERFLQLKRAYGAAADPREVVRRVLRDHCDPQGEFVLAKAWSAPFTRFMDFQSLLGLADHERLPRRAAGLTRYLCDRSVLFYSLWLQHTSLRLSGGHFADILVREHGNRRVRFVKFPHHLAHAANACYTSPFPEAACAVVDGQGEAGAMSF